MLRKLAVSAAASASAAALVLGFSTPAFALTWTVTGPTAPSAVSASSSDLTFTDVTANITANCASALANGTLPANSGSGAIITGLGITTNNCTSIITFNLAQNGTAELHATGPTVYTDPLYPTGKTPGEIRKVSVKGTALGGLCTVQVDGPGGANSQTGIVNGFYDNAGVIHATGATNITIASASFGCTIGGIKKGDVATLTGTFGVTSSPIPVVTVP